VAAVFVVAQAQATALLASFGTLFIVLFTLTAVAWRRERRANETELVQPGL
jgi:hypothetical protein